MWGAHWTLRKFAYFHQVYNVPLILREPRHRAGFGGRVDAFTEAVDVVPTLLEVAGARRDGPADGRSLAPFLRGEAPADWRCEAHWEFDLRDAAPGPPPRSLGVDPDDCPLAAIRGERWKYVHSRFGRTSEREGVC